MYVVYRVHFKTTKRYILLVSANGTFSTISSPAIPEYRIRKREHLCFFVWTNRGAYMPDGSNDDISIEL